MAIDTAAQAIRAGDIATLTRLLADNPSLATDRLGPRTLLHVAADWPGHFPNAAAAVTILTAAGADADAPFTGVRHQETPLHWAASSNDIAVLDALIDAGANIEAPGSIIGGGTPLADAVAFGQWEAARRLVERGARTTIWTAAGLGMRSRVEELCTSEPAPNLGEITNAFWSACHGGQRSAAEYLLARGADLNWIGHGEQTALDVARKSEAYDVAEWLVSIGAKSARESG